MVVTPMGSSYIYRDDLIFNMRLVFNVEMRKEEDENLERIKRRKLEEMMDRISGRSGETKTSSKISGKPLDLTDANFTSFVKENAMAVVDIWAPWYGPCRFVYPIV